MLQVREGDKQAMVNFFLLRWRQHYGEQLGNCVGLKMWRYLGFFLFFEVKTSLIKGGLR